MSVNIRRKGASGETEVMHHLSPIVREVYGAFELLPPRLQRNSLQSDAGGCDIVGLDWLAVEVKRCQKLAINTWWSQTVKQAGRDKVPVLFYRSNNKPWNVVMLSHLWVQADGALRKGVEGYWIETRCTVEIDAFLTWFRARLTRELEIHHGVES